MKTHTVFAGVALATLMLATAPAGAVSLNLGGSGGLVSLGGSGDSEPAGSGIDADVDVDVDADLGLDVLDGGGDGDGDAVLGLFGSGKPLIGTGGDNLVTIDTEDDTKPLVTLFGSPDEGLLGDQGLEVELLEEDRDDEVFIRLFGTGEGETTAGIDLGGDGTGLGDDAALIELFGSSSSRAGGGAGGPDAGGNGAGGGIGASSDGGGGGDGILIRSTTRVATVGRASARGACFSPDQAQIAHLLGRSSYQPGDVAAWQGAASISVVPVNLCPDAKARLDAALDADANIGNLRMAVASHTALRSELDPSYTPDDVLAVDRSGEALTVYVY